MKYKINTCFLAIMFIAFNASAQKGNTPAECYRLCASTPIDHPEDINDEYKVKLTKIQSMKKAETDPVKLKALEEAEIAELERLQRSLLKTCSRICKYDN